MNSRLPSVVMAALVTLLASPVQAEPALEVSAEVRLKTADGQVIEEGGDIPLGQPLSMELILRGPGGTTFFMPSNPAVDPFRLMGSPDPPARSEADGRVQETHRLQLLPLRMGAKALPPIEVPYRLGSDEGATVSTLRHRIHVRGHLENEQNPALGSAPPPVPVIATNWWLVWGSALGGGALLATLITLLVMRILKNRLEELLPGPPPPPADVVALAALTRLELPTVEPEERYTGACDVLRAYLGGRYGFDGMEQTTQEMMGELHEADLKGVEPTSIQRLLEDADLVKFARITPGQEEGFKLIDQVRTIVLETWEPPEEEVETPEVLYVPAPRSLRLQAGVLDVGLAGAIALVMITGLWAASLEELAWIPILFAGALLVLRDVGGRSPGKTWMGLLLVAGDTHGRDLTTRSRILRNVPLLLAPLGVPTEAMVLWMHPLGQRLGDQWAGTDVVVPNREAS